VRHPQPLKRCPKWANRCPRNGEVASSQNASATIGTLVGASRALGTGARPAVSRSGKCPEMPFLEAFYRDLLTRALCSPMQVGAAHAARTLRFRSRILRSRRRCMGLHRHALCGCSTQHFGRASREMAFQVGPLEALGTRRSRHRTRIPPRGRRLGARSRRVHRLRLVRHR